MLPTNRVGVTVGALLAWVADAGIIQLTEQSCAPRRTFTDKRRHPVMTGGPFVAGSTGTVINILTAVIPSPAINTHTLITAVSVVTRAAILACIWHQQTFINIVCALLACKFRFTLTVVGVNTIHTGSSILASMTRTVVNVVVAVFSSKTWNTGAFIAGVSFLDAGASIKARGRIAGQVAGIAVFPCVLLRALAMVPPDLINANSTVLARRWVGVTLIDVLSAILSREERCARTDVVGLNGRALATIATWV